MTSRRLAKRGQAAGSLVRLTGAIIRTNFRRGEHETGMPAFSPHLVRHTAASIMVRTNIDPFALQQILGHADLAARPRYETQSDEDLRAKDAAASPFDIVMRARLEAEVPPQSKRLSPAG